MREPKQNLANIHVFSCQSWTIWKVEGCFYNNPGDLAMPRRMEWELVEVHSLLLSPLLVGREMFVQPGVDILCGEGGVYSVNEVWIITLWGDQIDLEN